MKDDDPDDWNFGAEDWIEIILTILLAVGLLAASLWLLVRFFWR